MIKSNLRTTEGQARLDGLCLIYIHNDISINTGVIIKKLAAASRKIKLYFLHQRFFVATIISNS